MTLLHDSDRTFLEELAVAAIDSARVPPGQTAQDKDGRAIGRPNEQDFAIIRPGGRACYPALWTQDFTMTFACGLVPDDEGLAHLRLIASRQNGPDLRSLQNNAAIPAWAIPDHVNPDGSAVFFPGTYSPSDDQGGEPWGLRPPANNHYDFIWLAWMLVQRGGGLELLNENIAGIPLLERLRRAFDAVPVEADTGLVVTTAEQRFVGFIFCDSIYMTGRLLMASLLRDRAAGHLAELYELAGQADAADAMRTEQRKIRQHLPAVFAPREGRGWLRASTGISGQDDAWGTLYALWRGVLPEETAKHAQQQILKAMDDGVLLYEAAVRHVPTDGDATSESMWEKTITAHNCYQNGAYWHTPTGWLIAVLQQFAPDRASAVMADYVAHMRKHDFRLSEDHGAPWECIGPKKEAWQNDVFLPALTLPLSVLNEVVQ